MQVNLFSVHYAKVADDRCFFFYIFFIGILQEIHADFYTNVFFSTHVENQNYTAVTAINTFLI